MPLVGGSGGMYGFFFPMLTNIGKLGVQGKYREFYLIVATLLHYYH